MGWGRSSSLEGNQSLALVSDVEAARHSGRDNNRLAYALCLILFPEQLGSLSPASDHLPSLTRCVTLGYLI